MVFITHDINKAFKLGTPWRSCATAALIQVGTPEEIGANPADDYVRQFIDSADRNQGIVGQA